MKFIFFKNLSQYKTKIFILNIFSREATVIIDIKNIE